MSTIKNNMLGEHTTNMIENLALRLAECNQGRITAAHLLPYLPLSLEVIETALQALAAEQSSVAMDDSQHTTHFEFLTYLESEAKPKPLQVHNCVACDVDFKPKSGNVFCRPCLGKLSRELDILADKTGWPAQAVYEHELFYVAAKHKGLAHAEDIASHSRYTLRNTHKKLDAMSLAGYIQKEFDDHTNTVRYRFPIDTYSKSQYRDNMSVISTYPASMSEEIQLRLTRIFTALGVLILVLFVLAFLRFPYPLLMLFFIVAAPVISAVLWLRRNEPSIE